MRHFYFTVQLDCLKRVFGLFLLLSTSQLISQDILWEKSYGGIHSEYLFDIIPTPDYGFILAGSSLSGKSGNKTETSQGDFDYWIWKMNERGDLDWQRSYGGQGADHLKSIASTVDGGYILAGTSTSGVGGDKKEDAVGKRDLWIIKLNPEGGEQWQKTIGSGGQDDIADIQLASDGGYIIGATSNGSFSDSEVVRDYGGFDYWVIKLNQDGNIEWQKSFGGKYADKLKSIEPTQDGGYIVGGWSNSNKSGSKSEDSYGEGDFWILKLDQFGEIQWQRTLGGEQDDYLQIVFESHYGGYYAGGSSRSRISGLKTVSNGKGSDFWVVRLSENGAVIWQNTYDFGENDLLTSMKEQEDGNILIGGQAKTENIGLSRSDKKGIDDYIALKITSDGDEIWRQTIGSSGTDNLRKLIETRDGGYLLAGTSRGDASWDKNSYHGLSDFWVVKLLDKNKPHKERYAGLEAFPNPADTYTNIIVNHEYKEGVFTIYDIGGRQIRRLVVSDRLIPVNLQGLATGLYILTIATDIKTESVKILKK